MTMWINRGEERIRRLETLVRHQDALIDELCRKVGLNRDSVDPFAVDAEELRLLRENKKIVAIKHYRDRTGAGLREAKDIMDAAALRHGFR